MKILKDEDSQVGKKEDLTEVFINETLRSWNESDLIIPPLTLDYDIYKAVYRFEVSDKSSHFLFIALISTSKLSAILAENSLNLADRFSAR